jgi:hypothetical protein
MRNPSPRDRKITPDLSANHPLVCRILLAGPARSREVVYHGFVLVQSFAAFFLAAPAIIFFSIAETVGMKEICSGEALDFFIVCSPPK